MDLADEMQDFFGRYYSTHGVELRQDMVLQLQSPLLLQRGTARYLYILNTPFAINARQARLLVFYN